MKKSLKSVFLTCSIIFSAATFVSCGDELIDPIDDILDPPPVETGNVVNLPEGTSYQPVIEIKAEANSTVNVEVNFAEAEKKMYRLYISQNVWGSQEGTVAYDLKSGAPNIDTKRDGSIDLDKGDKVAFTKIIPLVTPSTVGGVIEYRLWATGGGAFSSAVGDYRDMTKNNAYGDKEAYITVKITAGATATVEETSIKMFSAKILAAPLGDGRSKSFMSVYNGQVYAIKGGRETAALWDFGYYYGKSQKASFASAADYPSNIVNVKSISGINTLNGFFFKKGSTLDFASVTASQLKGITKTKKQTITRLATGDVIEFVDSYGTKGLIKITKIKAGFGTSDYIQFDIKVQDTSLVQ